MPYVMSETLASASLRSALELIAEATGRPPGEVRREAEQDFAEMHCRRSLPAVWLFAALSRFIRQRGYNRQIVYDLDEVERLREESHKRSIVYLVTHKTYLDFFVLFDFLYRQGIPTPYIFGGINMNFAGFGGLARRAGGIFIRRSFKDDEVYKAVLQAYMETLIGHGASFMWAIEGTRSRTGKLLVPRLGLLNYVVRSTRDVGEESVGYVPVSVVYDQIPDVIDMAAQEAGSAKKPESLSWFFRYLKNLDGPFGNIYVRFGDAAALSDTPDAPDLEPDGKPGSAQQIEIQKLAFEVCYRINEITPATMTSLVLLVLLSRRRCDRDRIGKDVDALGAYIRKTDRRVIMKKPSRVLPAGPRESIDALLANGLVRPAGDEPPGLLEISPGRYSEAIYYSNMAVHHFVVSAFVETALACRGGPDAVWPECRRLRNLLKFEFFFSRSPVFKRQVEQELEEIDPDWKHILSGGEDSEVTLLRGKPLLVAPGILKPFTHAYRLVAETIHRHDRGCGLPDEALIELCLQANRGAEDGRGGGPPPPASRALLRNGLRLADSLGLRSGDTPAIRERRASFLEELERTDQALNRLQKIARQT